MQTVPFSSRCLDQLPGKAELKSTYSLRKNFGILVMFGLSFFCIYNLCIFKIDFKALIVMQMLKQKRSYIKQNL